MATLRYEPEIAAPELPPDAIRTAIRDPDNLPRHSVAPNECSITIPMHVTALWFVSIRPSDRDRRPPHLTRASVQPGSKPSPARAAPALPSPAPTAFGFAFAFRSPATPRLLRVLPSRLRPPSRIWFRASPRSGAPRSAPSAIRVSLRALRSCPTGRISCRLSPRLAPARPFSFRTWLSPDSSCLVSFRDGPPDYRRYLARFPGPVPEIPIARPGFGFPSPSPASSLPRAA
jgi:hypothetical protein